MLDCNRPTSVSKLSCTNKVDNDVNNNDDGQYFATPIKHNHSATTIRDTNTTTEQVQFEVNLRLCQKSFSVTKKTFKYLYLKGSIFVFKLKEELPSHHSVTN